MGKVEKFLQEYLDFAKAYNMEVFGRNFEGENMLIAYNNMISDYLAGNLHKDIMRLDYFHILTMQDKDLKVLFKISKKIAERGRVLSLKK
ncbi:MAG: hypothetical protein MUF50_02045 [Planctomycetes bacterium]|jgi:hypothetical protein|nr:hypothetical protein [Planctomycetota bacterium]